MFHLGPLVFGALKATFAGGAKVPFDAGAKSLSSHGITVTKGSSEGKGSC